MDKPDSVKIILQKTQYYMPSAVKGMKTTPDDFNLIFKLPTQSTSLIDQKDAETLTVGT